MKKNQVNFCKLIVCFLSMYSLLACDPCKKFAEAVCACKLTEEEKKECILQLSVAQEHTKFKKAKNENKCFEAMSKCNCEKINNNDDDQCAFIRE